MSRSLSNSPAITNKRPLTSLVIEDDGVDAHLLRLALNRTCDRDVVFLHHSDSDSALRELQEQCVDVIFIDYGLGSENGLEVVKKLRDAGIDKPMIVFTGMGSESLVSEFWRCGADEYLSKSDLTPETLRRSLKYAEGQYQRRQAELELKEKNVLLLEMIQKAQSSDAAKSEFLANMSHEIRTPMAAILGYADELLEPSLSLAERFSCANVIRQNGKHLLTLINDILDLSKIQAGKMTVERIPCSPSQVVGAVVSLMRPRAKERNLDLSMDYFGPIPETIQSDPTRLRQILINLVSNAIKFTHTGSVRITTTLLEAEKKLLCFEVRDTGIGVSREKLRSLFQPFSQADASTTRNFGGTGLGLTISKELAQMLGGDIIGQSSPDDGSSFMVAIDPGPLSGVKLIEGPTNTLVPDKADVTADLGARPELSARILLAEDVETNRKLFTKQLERAGAEVETAENGQETVEKALSAKEDGSPFDVVLMDMQMPLMNGYEATSELRRRGYTGPIVALTAKAMRGDKEECLDIGCSAYLAKPFDRKDLLQVIREQTKREDTEVQDPFTPEEEGLVGELVADPEMAEIVAGFRSWLAEQVAGLEPLLENLETQTAEKIAHGIKGVAGSLGFSTIMKAADRVTEQARADTDSEVLLESIRDLIVRCEQP